MTDVPDRVELVIVGAGVAGLCVAIRLAELGLGDVLVLDGGPIPIEGPASTNDPTSASGTPIFQTVGVRTTRRLTRRSVAAYGALELDGEPCLSQGGSIEVAIDDASLHALRRRRVLAQADRIEGAELLSPAETADRISLLRAGAVVGSLLIPGDGLLHVGRARAALARRARARGPLLRGGVTVTQLEVADGRVQGVRTDRGTIRCERVVLCAGADAARLGRIVGTAVPVAAFRYPIVRTQPMPELAADPGHEARYPLFRHPGGALDAHRLGDRCVIRNFRGEPDPLDPATLDPTGAYPSSAGGATERADGLEDVERAAADLLPAVAGRLDPFGTEAGGLSITPDLGPIAGEWVGLRGAWTCRPLGVADAAGLGSVVAEWIAEGEPPIDPSQIDVNRFYPFQTTTAYVRELGIRGYRETTARTQPAGPPSPPRALRRSPFHRRQQALGARFAIEAGWARPRWYEANARLRPSGAPTSPDRHGSDPDRSPIEGWEHLAARSRAALFDLTPLAKFDVMGPDSARFLERLCEARFDGPVGVIVNALMLTPSGGIRADLIVAHKDGELFRLVTEAGAGPQVLAWMRSHLGSEERVTIVERTSSLFALGLWGPRARQVLRSVTEADLSDRAFPPQTARYLNLGDVFPVWAQRISSVGEPGWELYGQLPMGERAWDVLWEAGRAQGLVAAGLGALGSLRLEAGRRTWGLDLDTEHGPAEARLGSLVRSGVGRGASVGGSHAPSLFACLLPDDPAGTVLGGEPVWADGRLVGRVSSAGFGHSASRTIARAYLPVELAAPGTRVEIGSPDGRLPATVAREQVPAGEGAI
ncbi:MAG TPA: FAD-dependent oxidoreductase [Actinomycetota bacterium]|nr:FAD-dependent oxidoreductase [Actinomycetota bacterium]